ncbi:MAG: hypothetical protein BM565_11420 [Gammaproteobacteria bacterium MedPE]|nr:MAG: hypothetical protein BM565_11420 [Gammaproteobacteria bacterium MedPE]
MTSPMKALNATEHKNVKIKQELHIEGTKNQQVLPLLVHEFAKAGSAMPVIFIRPSEEDKNVVQPASLLGLKPEENLFYKDGKWVGEYLPAVVTHHPFAMVPTQGEENRLQMLINESSPLVNDADGDALFDGEEQTEYLKKRMESLSNYFGSMQVTRDFCDFLVKKELLIEQTLTVEINGEKVQLNGLLLVDEKKLNEMSDEEHLELRKGGYLAPIYAHLGSLHHANKLAKLRAEA